MKLFYTDEKTNVISDKDLIKFCHLLLILLTEMLILSFVFNLEKSAFYCIYICTIYLYCGS